MTMKRTKINMRLFIIDIIDRDNNRMEFQEDSISDFISYKLNNPQALEKEMKLIQDRKQCVRKLQQYSKQMDDLKNELNAQMTILQTITLKRANIEQTYHEQIDQIQRQVVECKEKIQFTKKATKDKQNSSESYIKKYEQFQKQIVIRKQRTIEEHAQELTDLDEETDKLLRQKQQKKERRAALEEHLRKLKDRERIVTNTKQNIESVRDKWKTRHAELELAKQELRKKQQQIDQLMRLSKSMEKVIYGNLYKRCGEAVGQMKNNLDILYKFQNLEIADQGQSDHLESILAHLKLNKSKIMLLIKGKRDKYRVHSTVPEPEPKQYNFIVETKISPDLLPDIDPSQYAINDQMYNEIEQGQNAMLDKLEEQKQQFFSKQKAIQEEIQSLQKRLVEFEDQIEIKRRTILSPTRKRR